MDRSRNSQFQVLKLPLSIQSICNTVTISAVHNPASNHLIQRPPLSGYDQELIVIIIYQSPQLFSIRVPKRPPWLRGGWRREIGSTRSEPGQGGVKRKNGGARGLYYESSIPGWRGWKPAELLPSGSGWGPRELGQGKTTLNPRYQSPGAISAYQPPSIPRLRSTIPLSDDFFDVSIFCLASRRELSDIEMHGPGLLISRSNGGLAIGTCARKDDRVRRDRFRETRARNCAKSCEVDRSIDDSTGDGIV